MIGYFLSEYFPMYESIFMLLMLIAVYQVVFRPKMETMSSVTDNDQLKKHLDIIAKYRDTDKRSYDKFHQNIVKFFNAYMQSHDFYSDKNPKNFDRLKKYKDNISKYMNRIPLRLHNDLVKSQELYNSVYNLNTILESYTYESANKHKTFYHSADSQILVNPKNF